MLYFSCVTGGAAAILNEGIHHRMEGHRKNGPQGEGKGVGSHTNSIAKTIAGLNCLVPAEQAGLKGHFHLFPSVA